MATSPDQTRAAALVAGVVLTAGMFAGFAFGVTGRDAARETAPLLLQSASVVRYEVPDCDQGRRERQANAARQSSALRGGV